MNNQYTKGTPITVNWFLKRPDGAAYSLAGYQYVLRGRNSRGAITIESSVVNYDEGYISFVLTEDMQTATGFYSFVLDLYMYGHPIDSIVANDVIEIIRELCCSRACQCVSCLMPRAEIISVGQFNLFAPSAPVPGSDGYWYFNGERIKDDSGNDVPVNYTLDIVTEGENTGRIIINQGRETEEVIDNLKDALAASIAAAAAASSAATIAEQKAVLAAAAAAAAASATESANAAEVVRESNETLRQAAEAERAIGYRNDRTRAQSDHTKAASDHTTATSDHTTAASDHTTAASDHTTAASDHTTAASDHVTAASDHTMAESDHALAVADRGAAVLTTEQTLTSAQKLQARNNMSAAVKVTHVTETSETISSLTPNVLHVWSSPISTLHILSLAEPEDSNEYNEYMLRFTAASDFTHGEQMFPVTIRWANEPDFSAGYTYEISILDNIGVILEIGGDE